MIFVTQYLVLISKLWTGPTALSIGLEPCVRYWMTHSPPSPPQKKGGGALQAESSLIKHLFAEGRVRYLFAEGRVRHGAFFGWPAF